MSIAYLQRARFLEFCLRIYSGVLGMYREPIVSPYISDFVWGFIRDARGKINESELGERDTSRIKTTKYFLAVNTTAKLSIASRIVAIIGKYGAGAQTLWFRKGEWYFSISERNLTTKGHIATRYRAKLIIWIIVTRAL